jgi:hypothetical protein
MEPIPQDIIDLVILWEGAQIEDGDLLLKLFSFLVRTGHSRKLQGFYGREAEYLISRGIYQNQEK